MLPLVLVFSGLLSANLVDSTPPREDVSPDYQTLAARTSDDADAQVGLALWCEAKGLEAECREHLGNAIRMNPSHAKARALLGQIDHKGTWGRSDAIIDRVRNDAALTASLVEYNAKREKIPNTADAQWKLALWCEKKGLEPEARAHLTVVTRLSPRRSEAWVRLGYKRYGKRWMTEEQIAAEHEEALAQKRADLHWHNVLEKYRNDLVGNSDKQSKAERGLASVTDPRAVRSVWKIFVKGRAKQQVLAVKLLSQIDATSSSMALAALALFGKSREVRDSAAGSLSARDPRDFLGSLISLLEPTVRFRSSSVVAMDRPGELVVEGEQFNLRRIYVNLSPQARRNRGDQEQRRPGGLSAQEELDGDIRWIKAYNGLVSRVNSPLVGLLHSLMGEDVQNVGDDSESWKAWWADQQGYVYVSPTSSPKPTLVQVVARVGHSCFAAGTVVNTLAGNRSIESLRVGDRVLSQDPRTGSLGYQPIVAVYHNPPNKTLRITLADEEVVATGIHRFWKAGKGWVMARDLKTGDAIRTLGGISRVVSIEVAAKQPVFNLEIAEGHSFFVGKRGLLVHDNSLGQPTPEPFDAARVVAR
ncbi:MAG: hypothetical protein NVSMB14_02400 [Isosphaeraceae bacterium]